MPITTPLDYNELRAISPKAARQAILQILKANKGKVTPTARMLGITRATVYKALVKKETGNLDDSSRSPKLVHNKTPVKIEQKVVTLKKRTNYGPLRLQEELWEVYQIKLSEHTIRNIVRRNKKKDQGKRHKPHKKGTRQFVDWYSAKPFEVVQVDLKYVVDQKALSMQQIDHIHANHLPLYQWGAIDVNSRFKLIAYSDEKSWTNGLTWFLWVISWLRSHGVTAKIVFTVDRGEEFGGRSWFKIVELRKLLSAFGCRLIQNHKASPQENAHLERSHRTDDDEFYIPRILKIHTRQEFFVEAFNYIYYYNTVRKHSGINRETPWQRLNKQDPNLDARMKYVPPLILDNISVNLGDWSGYHVLAQNHCSPTHTNHLIIFFHINHPGLPFGHTHGGFGQLNLNFHCLAYSNFCR
jgi:putative transposase